MKKPAQFLFLTVALSSVFWAPAMAQTTASAFTGSFVKFDRNLTSQMWQQEIAAEAAIGHKILIVQGAGSLMPSSTDATGYTVNPQTLIYPSSLFPTSPPQTDNLGMLLTAADQFGMQVYVGSLQTYGAWSNGQEFDALHKYDPIVAGEILSKYGSHPSLSNGNWYFGHEIWINWVKFYGSGYYGIQQLADYVSEMKALNSKARVIEAPVFKESASGSMPGLSASETGTYLAMLASGSDVNIVAPQDGAGAKAGAPPVAELGSYYLAMRSALAASISSGSVQLWSTTESYQAASQGTESANGWQPAPLSRIRQQLRSEAPYVTQIIEYIYGWDMSPEATYTPVEADTLDSQYRNENQTPIPLSGATVSYSISPSPEYADTVPSKLTNGTGGGFDEPLDKDWVGFIGASSGTVTITVALGSSYSVSGVRALFASATNSGIYFPQNVIAEYSPNGSSWKPLGSAAGQNAGVASSPQFSIEWVDAATGTPVTASFVRIMVSFTEWLFVSEIKVMTAGGS